MESTAALIPFDRLFKFSANELTEEYRVNLFKKIKEENAELLGMFGEDAEGKCSESEAEAEGDSEKDEKEIEDKDDNMNFDSIKKKSKKNKKVSRKIRELEYDFDDPFIDDSEITDVYQSVFELMRGGGDGDDDEDEDGKYNNESDKCNSSRMKTKERNFFVYRGVMTPEILSKEFEIDVEEFLESEGITNDGEFEEEEEDKIKKESKKRKTSSSSGGGGNGSTVKKPKTVKPVKTIKEPKRLKEAKELKESKEDKKKKPNDLIAQSAKKFNDLFSNEEVNEKIVVPSVAAPVFNVNGVDPNLLELREVLKRFRDSAVGTPFSPGKFPSLLRPRLNESICTVLRVCRPSSTALFPVKLFPALASFLPFSSSALNKLLTKKILGPLIEGIEKNELPKMYEGWRKIIEKRIIEGGYIEVPTISAISSVPQQLEQSSDQINVQSISASPVKKRLKFSEEMRQQVFDIVRLESDLNNLFCLSNYINSNTSIDNVVVSFTPRSVQSELNLRKNAYQKLMNLSSEIGEIGGVPLLSTTEISKEFGIQKRKHEKKVSKSASEILFSETEIEDLLKELDVRKESTVQVNSTTQLSMDPLNLFATNDDDDNNNNEFKTTTNDQSNTSLYIESNQ